MLSSIQVSHNILLIRKIGILILLRTNPTLILYSSGGENAELRSEKVQMRGKGFQLSIYDDVPGSQKKYFLLVE